MMGILPLSYLLPPIIFPTTIYRSYFLGRIATSVNAGCLENRAKVAAKNIIDNNLQGTVVWRKLADMLC